MLARVLLLSAGDTSADADAMRRRNNERKDGGSSSSTGTGVGACVCVSVMHSVWYLRNAVCALVHFSVCRCVLFFTALLCISVPMRTVGCAVKCMSEYVDLHTLLWIL